MASISPSPNYAAALPPPDSSKSPPPQPSPSPPPPNPLSSPSPENASQSRSSSTASTPSPLIASPPSSPSPPPPMASTPATAPPPSLQRMPSPSPPVSLPPPSSSPPPPPLADPPVKPPPTPPPSDLPASSPPPPISNPPATSQPPPSDSPTSPLPPSTEPPPPPRTPSNAPPIVPEPPNNAPPPPTAKPPRNSPLPPRPRNPPPESSPPPPTSDPPENSPSPPTAKPPQKTPPPPPSIPPETPSPPNLTPPPPASPTSSNSLPRSPPPPPITQIPPLSSTPSPPSPALVPPLTSNTNTTTPNVGPSSQPRGGGGISTGGTIAIGLVLAFLLLSITGTAAWCIWKRKKKAHELNGVYIMPNSIGSSPRSDAALLKAQKSLSNHGSGSVHHHSRSFFTYEQLVVATNGFSPQNLLGEGGFGSVYKGTLPDGKEVAVKLLKVGGQQGEREFRLEVEIISRIHHRHLVSLVGYCISDNTRLLVFDYVANDTLYFHLHGESRPVMDWPTRVKIAIGAARGIAYLHEDCHPRIIHRDIKSSNILLDNNLEARVSDFGLAKLAIDTNTHITTRVMGTFGYMAPEYASSGKLTEKSDVFSFGVVLLELITGRKPVDTSQPLGDESLVEWARPLLSHALETEAFDDLADPRLERNYVDSEMFRLIEVAAACIRHSAAKRPKMGQVVRALDSMAGSDLTNGMRLGESEMFNSAQQSEEIRLFRRMAFGSQNYSPDYLYQSSWSSSSGPSKY